MTFWSGSPTTMGRRFVAVLVWTLSAGQEPEEIDCEDDFCFGCQMLNYCNGHGRCSAGGGDPSPFVTCVCDKGWGSPDDIATEKDALCMLRTCPKGRATSDLPFSKNEAHPMRECSNNGVCDRLTGKCLCFASWAGATCQRKLCPNECSGHGQCMTMKELARRSDALPLNDGFSGWNVTAPEAPARAPGSEWKNGSVVRYEGSASSTTWDESIGVGCLCDSSWTVGLGAGETQAPEFFGADCSLRRCPSHDDPMTAADETDCANVTAAGGHGVGKRGNKCHVECSNRGTCDYGNGLCKCFKGHTGVACERQTTIY